MTTNSALLLVNPNSRRGKESLPVVREHLSRAGIVYLELPAETTNLLRTQSSAWQTRWTALSLVAATVV